MHSFKSLLRPLHGVRYFSTKDYYKILNSSPSDSFKDIKKKYRALAKKYHPDSSSDPQTEKKFQEISEAFNYIKKKEEDPNYGEEFSGGFGNPFDIFNSNMWGGGGGRTRRQHYVKPDIHRTQQVNAYLSFWEAVLGGDKTFDYQIEGKCQSCEGSGVADNAKPDMSSCVSCNGSGTVDREVRDGNRRMIFRQECETCGGAGRKLANVCRKCDGRGLHGKVKKQCSAVIPPGVSPGSVINDGNAMLVINVQEEIVEKTSDGPVKLMVIDGAFVAQKEISGARAMLGGKITVMDAKKKEIEVNIGTVHSNETQRLRKRGIKGGDAYLKLVVKNPTDLTAEQRRLLEEFEEIENSKKQSFHSRRKSGASV